MSVWIAPGSTQLTVMPLAAVSRARVLGKAEESGFGGGAIGPADSAGLADERADVDYASGSSVEKMAEDCLGHEERSGQIYPED